jgi:hypothetical protein
MEYTVPIHSIRQVTHNVRQYRLEKPAGYQFLPGQATEVSINHPEWINERRPFTFTCLNDDPYLEFIIKSYPHEGVTKKLGTLKEGDELIIRDVWGTINYKGEGYFIAGGAGITPFIAILRNLKKQNMLNGNQLFFSNQTPKDIILKEELENILGSQVLFTTTRQQDNGYLFGHIDEAFLKKHVTDFSKHFYMCGPDTMVQGIQNTLYHLGAQPETLVFEQ